MIKIKNWIFKKVAPLAIFILSAPAAMAVGGLSGQTPDKNIGIISIPNPLGASSFSELINKIIDFLIFIGTPLATLMILIAAFQIMSAGGDVEKVSTGRKTIQWAALGYVLLLISKGIVLVINSVLGVN